MDIKDDFQVFGIDTCGAGGPISCRRPTFGVFIEVLRCPWGTLMVRSRTVRSLRYPSLEIREDTRVGDPNLTALSR